MYRFFLIALTSVLIAYILVGILLFFFQRKLIYSPTPKIEHEFNEFILENEEQKIRIIMLNTESDSAILYFGGNGESAAYTAMDLQKKLSSHSIYLMNYRGYGGSSGHPEEEGLYSDALSLYDSLDSTYKNIFVLGRSLGSGVASYVASKRPVKKLVLITPFDSVKNVAQKRFPYYPISVLLKDNFDSASRAKKIKSNVLVLSAEHDIVVSEENTRHLIESLTNANLSSIVINETGHNSISEHKEYYHSINEFLQ